MRRVPCGGRYLRGCDGVRASAERRPASSASSSPRWRCVTAAADTSRSRRVSSMNGTWHGALTTTSASSTTSSASPSIRYATWLSSPLDARHDSVASITHPLASPSSSPVVASPGARRCWCHRSSRSGQSTRPNTSRCRWSYGTPSLGVTLTHTPTRDRSPAHRSSTEHGSVVPINLSSFAPSSRCRLREDRR